MSAPVTLPPRHPLTPAQELIWTSQRLHPEVPLANMATIVHFGAEIDPDRFVAAVDTVVAGSDALRMIIREVDGVPHPTVVADPPSNTAVMSLPRPELDGWMARRIAVPLALDVSMYDSVLLDHGGGSWSWWMDVHHIATDAASAALIYQAVAAAYHGVWEPATTYAELTEHLLAERSSSRWEKAARHWAAYESRAEPTQLYRPDRGPTTRAEQIDVELRGERQSQLDELLAGRFRLLSPDLSLTVALATALSVYLTRLSGRDRVTIGLPVHHRAARISKDVIGPLVELFPVDIDVQPDDSFASLQERAAKAVFDTLFVAQPGTSPRQAFDVVLNVHGATFGSFGDIPAVSRWVHSGHIDSHHRLRVQALDYTGDGQLELALDINHCVADADHCRRAGDHFGAVLDAMLTDPDRMLATVGLVGPEERQLLDGLVDTGPGRALDAPAPQLVQSQLAHHGGSPAAREGDRVMTGHELDAAIDHVARRLRAAGLGPGDLIAVEMPIGLDALIVLHGVLRAGAAFVPVDPEYPEERRDHLRRDSGACLVVRAITDFDDLPPGKPAIARPVTFDDLAYVIYTSGSTGLPKGVPITHRGLAEYLGFAFGAYVGPTPPVMPLFTSLSFDLTITTLFLPLLSGGVVTVHPAGGLVALRQIVDEGEVTLLKATPSHLELLVRMIGPDHPLAGLVVGGEAFVTDLADRLLDVCRPGLRVFNEYGPTEAVVGCMIHEYDPASDPGPEVPIGRPAPGVALHILDAQGLAVPVGVAGELHISRPGLTAGYLNRPDLNAEKFGMTADGTRTYRTGDRVRLLDIDRMIYLGRIDDQIKVRGIRLEPGEIEVAAQSVPGVRRAVAGLWHPDATHEAHHCVRCGLGDDVPNVVLDGDGVCNSCHEYDLVAPQAAAWFRTEEDLAFELTAARARSTGDYDVLHLLSGGKDSTYALYRLVDMGARVLALTLDTGYLSEAAKDNVRRATTALGVDHEFVTVDAMNEIFRDSLERFSNVCNGCYKAIYTVALQTADALGIPAIVTGLSRGQFFETRLVPGMFGAERFDPDAIEDAVLEARKHYHRTPDAVSANLDVGFLADDDVFERIRFIDFYRYVDVQLADMYRALEASGTWERPPDTGRSTNCTINSAGIFVHRLEQGHHNYAVPYSWDVRLGHKTREEAMEELDDPMDDDELANIATMLADVGYEPRPAEVLTLWIEADEDFDVEPVRVALREQLPAHAQPQAIETLAAVPLTTNGKVDMAALPAPAARRTATSTAPGRVPETRTEQRVADIWARVLGVDGLSTADDFFAVGGTSLHALEMIVRLSEAFGVVIPESIAFTRRTIAEQAAAVEEMIADPEAQRGRRPIPELDSGDAPLSSGEEALLYEWRLDPADMRYNVARLYRIPGGYDRARLDRAVRAVVAHQPTLHTSYGADRDELPVEQALRIGEASAEAAPLETLADRLNQQQFDLVHGPLVTLHHLRSGAEGDSGVAAVLLRTHHIVSDAGSLDVLWDQIDCAYRGEELPQLEATYAAHGQWQRAQRPAPESAWDIAPDELLGELSIRPAVPGRDGYVERAAGVTTTQLRDAPGATPFATALAAIAVALAPYHDAERFELAITASVRDHPALEHVVGYFLNPLPLLVDLGGCHTVADVAEMADERLAGALGNRSVPFSALVGAARERGTRPPQGRIMLALEDLAPASLGGAEVEHTILSSGTAVNDLTFFVQLRGEHVDIGCEYRGTAVDRAQAERLLDRFGVALDRMATRPTSGLDELAAPGRELRGAPLGPTVLVPERIGEIIEISGDRCAVSSGGRSLSYAELDHESRALAGRLRGCGVSPGDRVAVVVPRSVDLPLAIRAVWLVGASYVPIDIGQPSARVAELAAMAGVAAAVTSGHGHAGLSDVPTLRIDDGDVATLPVTSDATVEPEDEAYVIFTSGSTGRPKGVSVSHGNLAASLTARLVWYPAPVERFLLVSSAGFDSSVAGLFWTLAHGGELVVPSEEEVHDVDALLEIIDRRRPTHMLCVPSLYGALLMRHRGALPGLETIIVAGESCPVELVERHHDLGSGSELVNEYGPTEATVWASAYRCTSDQHHASVPIGGPIPGAALAVVDPSGHRQPIDVAGELWIGGKNVATGYIDGDPDGRFVVTSGGQRMYRTGDRVVCRSGDVLEFLGRLDEQLSIGGVRIEPAEIEQALTTVPGVQAAAVGSRDNRLIAWVETSADVDVGEMRSVLSERVAVTHIPNRIVPVEALPRNANGKIDRRALEALPVTPAPSAPPDTSSVQSGTLGRVVALWSEAFDGVAMDADSDFFALGGDSLRAVVLVSLLEREFGVRVGIGELVDAPTPASLAPRLEAPGAPDVGTIDHGDVGEDAGDLVEWLRSSGTRDPLVVLPPGGGNLLRYAPLVGALDPELPVVGIRLPGADARTEPVSTVEEQAAVMLSALDTVVAPRRYRLLGWSTGGLIAWEMARLLLERGDDVEIVVLVDTLMGGMSVDDARSPLQKYADLLRDEGARAVAEEGSRRLRERAQFSVARLRYRRARERGATPDMADAERRLGPVIRRASAAYRPRALDAAVFYVAASESGTDLTVDPWSALQPDLEVVTVAGVHFLPEDRCILGSERVGEVVDELERRLD